MAAVFSCQSATLLSSLIREREEEEEEEEHSIQACQSSVLRMGERSRLHKSGTIRLYLELMVTFFWSKNGEGDVTSVGCYCHLLVSNAVNVFVMQAS
jgi:hypothetical protein